MEPEQLKRGKELHKRVQSDWQNTSKDGQLYLEYRIDLPSLNSMKHFRRGRLDMFVDELSDYVSVVEIKSTDWDKLKLNNLQKLMSSHRRQIWKYITKYLDNDKMDVCPGIIYPNAPKSDKLRQHIEKYLNEYGIQVVWCYD